MATMKTTAVILAAGMGTRLRPLTDSKPKCLVPVAGRSLLERMLDSMAQAGIEDAVVVTGYEKEQVEAAVQGARVACRCVFNPRYADANNYYSLLVAREAVAGRPFMKLDGDVIFEPVVLRRVMDGPGWIRVGVDIRNDLGAEEMKVYADHEGRIQAMSKKLVPSQSLGESVGIEFISVQAVIPLFEMLAKMADEGLDDEYYEYAYDQLARSGRDVRVVGLSDLTWTEIDDLADLKHAEELFGGV